MFGGFFGKKTAETEKKHPYFPPVVTLGNQQLVCNGIGLRERLVVKIYQAALYLPSPTRSAEKALQMTGPKQIRLLARRELTGGQLASALLTGIRSNAETSKQALVSSQMKPILDVFSSQASIPANHTFRIDLIDDEGAFFFIDDNLKGKPINAPGFNEAVLRIWLGPNPADPELKTQLLAGNV